MKPVAIFVQRIETGLVNIRGVLVSCFVHGAASNIVVLKLLFFFQINCLRIENMRKVYQMHCKRVYLDYLKIFDAH